MTKAQISSEINEHSFIRMVRFPNHTPSVKGSVWFQTLHIKVHFILYPTVIFISLFLVSEFIPFLVFKRVLKVIRSVSILLCLTMLIYFMKL